MGFKNKKAKSKVGNPGGSGRPVGEFSELDEQEKRDYFNNAVHKHRYGTERPKKTSTVDKNLSSSSSSESEDESSSVGRPPLHLVAMSPNKLRVRMSFLNAKKRKQKRVSEVRRAAVMKRWNTAYSDQEDSDASMDSDSILNCEDETLVDNENDIQFENDNNLADNQQPESSTSGYHRVTLWRRRCQIRGILTTNPIDNLHVLLSFNRIFQIDYNLSAEIRKIRYPSYLSAKQYRYRAKKMKIIFEGCDEQSKLMVYWLDELLCHSTIEAIFNECGVLLPPEFTPQGFYISQRAAELARKFTTCSTNTADDIRVNGVRYVVEVAKDCQLSPEKYGDGTLLAKAVSCSVEFAEKVLRYIQEGREEELLKRHTRVDAIKCTEWPAMIKTFVLLPENSRSVPGQQQVSVRYGVRLPKYILLNSRESIASDFKLKYPECPFKASTIMREFPQNAVTPTSRDAERNTCPTHANVRRLVR